MQNLINQIQSIRSQYRNDILTINKGHNVYVNLQTLTFNDSNLDLLLSECIRKTLLNYLFFHTFEKYPAETKILTTTKR